MAEEQDKTEVVSDQPSYVGGSDFRRSVIGIVVHSAQAFGDEAKISDVNQELEKRGLGPVTEQEISEYGLTR